MSRSLNPDGPFNSAQAATFGEAAAEYERGRPSYPAEAVDWLLPAGAGRVVDLGAGTGKLTRLLVERGLDVLAVEPSDGMRAQLTAVLPGVVALPGSAENTGIEDRSVDAVLVAQAWHWVDPVRAVPEMARILRPGGTLGLVWNMRDTTVDWVARLGDLLAPYTFEGLDPEKAGVGAPFGELDRHEVRWANQTTPEQLVDLVASRSYVISAAEPARQTLLDGVRELIATHPAIAGRQRFDLPYVTKCYRASLPV